MTKLSRTKAAPLAAALLALVAQAAAADAVDLGGAIGTAEGSLLAAPGRYLGRGKASFYGPGLHGRRTASGERFDRTDLTAAHPTLPFGTRVRVENLLTGRSVVVRINDRGPFSKDRIIDLSEAAAALIGLHRRRGVAPVRITAPEPSAISAQAPSP